jgi:lysophospholipase
MKSSLLLLLCTLSPSAFAIGESNYAADYQSKVIPLIQSYQYGTMSGEKGVAINYASYTSNPDSQRCVVILPGRSESIEKYAELVYDLDHSELAGEFTYFLMDHRGQGSSGRMVSDSEKGYVKNFAHYTKDLKKFLDTVVAKKNCSDTSLIAHSLGAGIATDLMQKYPGYFDRAALTSPMLKIQTKPYKYFVAKAIVELSVLAGFGKKFAPGQSGYDPIRNFEENTFTSSPARYEMTMNLNDLFPATRLGGPTNRWVLEVMQATRTIRKNYDKIEIPVKVFHAGIETYSEKSEMIRFCDEVADCERTYLETSKHEVLMDRDVNRDVVIAGIIELLKS